MKGIALRKRKSFPNIPCLMLAQRAIPTLHVRRLSALFANRLVRFLRQDFSISIPEIAVGNTTAILHWNFVPQTTTGRFATIPDHKGDDLSGSTAHHCPQPAFIGLLDTKLHASSYSKTLPGSTGSTVSFNLGRSLTCSTIHLETLWRATSKVLSKPRKLMRS